MGRSIRPSLGIICAVMYPFLWAYTSVAQVATTASAEYSTPALRAKAAAEMDPWIRGSLERTGALVDSLGLHADETIADVTGVGHLLPYILKEIGSSGTIFAVDIDPDFVAKTRQRISAGGTCMHYSARTTITQKRFSTLRSELLDGRADHVGES